MKIYSISFNKGDYAYSISFHNDNDDVTLDTNEEARNSLLLSKGTLAAAVRDYARISDDFEIVLNTVRFGDEKKDNSISFTARTISKEIFPRKIINCNLKIARIAKREKEVEPTRARVLLLTDDLYCEVERYLAGDRAQQQLPLEEEHEEEDVKKENTDTDLFDFDVFE